MPFLWECYIWCVIGFVELVMCGLQTKTDMVKTE